MSSYIHSHVPLPRPLLSISEPLLRLPTAGEVRVNSSRGKLLYFLSGEAFLSVENHPPTLVREGSLAVLPKRCIQTYQSATQRSETIHAFCIRFLRPTMSATPELSPSARALAMLMRNAFRQPSIQTDGITASIRQKLLLLREEMEEKHEGRLAMLHAISLSLCVETARSLSTTLSRGKTHPGRRKARQLINGALGFMASNLQEGLSVEKIAWAMNVSAEHLCRVFREQNGLSPREALRNLQMDEAKNLLLHSSLEIHRVAAKAGFASVTSFCRAFKAHAGLTATDYRCSHREFLSLKGRKPLPPSGP